MDKEKVERLEKGLELTEAVLKFEQDRVKALKLKIKELKQQLDLSSVSHRRELLIDFKEEVNKHVDKVNIPDSFVDYFIDKKKKGY